MLAPIVLFTYNRPTHTARTLKSLLQNALTGQSDLFIYSDAPKDSKARHKVARTRQYLRAFKARYTQAFQNITIIERERNFGLADSIIDGVTHIIKQYGKIIVLEDDILVSPVFLDYMNDALSRYEQHSNVWAINAHTHPIDPQGLGDCYFWYFPDPWGWGTWHDRWQHFRRDTRYFINNFSKQEIMDINLNNSYNAWQQILLNKSGKIKTWAIFFYCLAYKHNALSLTPSTSYIHQIGLDGSGIHCSSSEEVFNSKTINTKFPITYPQEIKVPTLALQRIYAFNKSLKLPLIARIKRKLKTISKKLKTQIAPRPRR